MKVCALVSFYDEEPGLLVDSMHSLAGLADHVVALDGAYALYEGGQPSSPPWQHEALRQGCDDAGLTLDLHVPERVWEHNEVGKRDALFRLGESATSEDDWYCIHDADFFVTSSLGAREALAQTDLLAGDVCVVESNGRLVPHRYFFRALRGIRVRNTHYQYRVEPDGPYLWDFHRETVPGENLTLTVLIDHNDDRRPAERDIRRWGYYKARSHALAEIPDVDRSYRASRDLRRTRALDLFGVRAGRERSGQTEAQERARADAHLAMMQSEKARHRAGLSREQHTDAPGADTANRPAPKQPKSSLKGHHGQSHPHLRRV